MSLEWSGLNELHAALRNLPAEMTQEAAHVIRDTTDRVASQLRAVYPGDATGTGNLRNGVRKSVEQSPAGALGVVRSTSKHAHLWEYGTQNRRTQQGWNRGRGPSHTRIGLSAIAARARRVMNAQLIEIVRRAGFDVTGTP